MTAPPSIPLLQSGDTSLPEIALTRSRVSFDPRPDRWEIIDGVDTITLDFSVVSNLTEAMKRSWKKVTMWTLEQQAPASGHARWNDVRRLLEYILKIRGGPIDAILPVDLVNYNGDIGQHAPSTVAGLSTQLGIWSDMGWHGVGIETILEYGNLDIAPRRTGEKVLTMDPTGGPLTSIELEAVIQALELRYGEGAIDEDMFLLSWLLILIAARPAQYAALKVCDIVRIESPTGVKYVLRVPRVKQRETVLRDEFRDRPLIKEVGEMVYAYAQRVRQQFVGRLEDPDQAPMFPTPAVPWGNARGGRKSKRNVYEDARRGFEFHPTKAKLGSRLATAFRRLKTNSERTGGRMQLTPQRFRFTAGTRAAVEGWTALEIAWLLDHSDTQNVLVYIKATGKWAVRVNKQVAKDIAPLAQAFQGRPIAGESEATRGSDPASHIVDYRVSDKTLGQCGACGDCVWPRPEGCYPCPSFEPWLDGPHAAKLNQLLRERDKDLEKHGETIAAINDRVILAVQQVMMVCEAELERRGQARG